MKKCRKCGEFKELECFGVTKQTKDGLRTACKECTKTYNDNWKKDNPAKVREHDEKWRKENKEKIKEINAQYYKDNIKHLRANQAEYYKNNSEKLRAYAYEYVKNNPEKIKESNKTYREKNADKINKYAIKYAKENPEKFRIYKARYRKNNPIILRVNCQKRRTLKKKLDSTLTIEQWVYIKNIFNNRCAYCGISEEEHKNNFNEVLHQEHFQALNNNGEYSHNNIIPACRSCNSSKGVKDFFEWYPTYEHYDTKREQFVLEYLGYTTENTQQLSIL